MNRTNIYYSPDFCICQQNIIFIFEMLKYVYRKYILNKEKTTKFRGFFFRHFLMWVQITGYTE